ncbi:hypothetical protein OTU49_016648 [Cherax quadricarinatus]|uniref:C2H2-type domain-containing protein n=2 Tax=Cherax quadricarinatus TaxID=27406 RepID=A0AAW0Y596_CHEQU
MFHRFHDLKAGQDSEMMSEGSRSSTPAHPVESRIVISSSARQDHNNPSHQAEITSQYSNTSSPGPGFAGQGASLMALGHNVMFHGGKSVPGAAQEAHRYVHETYRLVAGDAEAYRTSYVTPGNNSQSLVTDSQRTIGNITLPSATTDRPPSAIQRHSESDRVHCSSVHMNLDNSRLEGHSSRFLFSVERLPHHTSKSSVPKVENEPTHFGKSTYSTVSDALQLSLQATKCKSTSSSAAGSHVFPVPFTSSFQHYSEENSANYKRHYFEEASATRREASSNAHSTEGNLTQINRIRNESGNTAVVSDLTHFSNDCSSQNIYGQENLSRPLDKPENVNAELDLGSQATISSNSEIMEQPDIPKGRQTKAYICCTCGLEFKNGTQLKNHTWRHTGEKPYSCEECQATFTQQSNLKTHRRIHTGERPYKCKECTAAFTQISNLRTHQKIHTGEKPYECDICFTRFSQQSNLKSHKLIHSGERPFKCEECGASFVQSTHLRNHKRIHTNERPYSCDRCGARFRQLSNLKTHEKIHTGERPHVCEECGSAFAQKSNLKSHKLKLHSDDGAPSRRGRKKKLEAIRPFICEECGAKFTMMSNLKIHMRLHSGEKPFHCTLCSVSFAQRSNLKAHELTHSDERPHKCPECPAAFKQKVNLKTHKIKKHQAKSLKIKILQDSQHIMKDLKDKIIQDSQYIMQDPSQAEEPEGEGSSYLMEEPIVQIREGREDQSHIPNENNIDEGSSIKFEEGYDARGITLQQKNMGTVSEHCSSETDPYDNPNF